MLGHPRDRQIDGHTGNRSERRAIVRQASRVVAGGRNAGDTCGRHAGLRAGRRPWELTCGRQYYTQVAAKRQE